RHPLRQGLDSGSTVVEARLKIPRGESDDHDADTDDGHEDRPCATGPVGPASVEEHGAERREDTGDDHADVEHGEPR
ncbi:hypothetical protein, partial [Mycobacterium tuberculosis]|uniref:hypothetical protein n=1 Tax=Mycobacterium tuberculosis TaxID=1773 RepID=UPI001F17D531